MIKSVNVINHLGERVEIVLKEEEPKHGLLLTGIDGLGPAKANISTSSIATLDGVSANSARLDSRNIVFHFRFTEASTIEDARLNTYRYFPIKKPIHIVFETDNRFVETVGFVESNEPNIFSNQEDCTISVVCPDSYFYSVDPITVIFDDYTGDRYNEEIFYDGSADNGVNIKIAVNSTPGNIVIKNWTTGQEMTVDDDSISSLYYGQIGSLQNGDVIDINTASRNKSIYLVRGQTEYNLINALGRNPDWINLTKGYNTFVAYAENGLATADFELVYKNAYEGI